MINEDEVQKIAKLAMLNLTKVEEEYYSPQIDKILAMISILDEVDCSEIAPLTSVSNMQIRMRSDTVKDDDLSDELFANVPDCYDNFAKTVKCFAVPKIVE